jgi:hypothetical protein
MVNSNGIVIHKANHKTGRKHCFYEFGPSMRILVYHPIFVLG